MALNFKKVLKEKEQDRCARCGACLSFCPVYQVTLKERFSPRGKNLILRRFKPSRRERLIKETVSACLQCGACKVLCSAGADIASLIRKKRKEVSHLKSVPSSLFSIWEKFGDENTGLLFSRLSKIWNDHLYLPQESKGLKPFLKDTEGYEIKYPPLIETQKRVILFLGCLQNYLFKGLSLRLLMLFPSKNLIILEKQTCCGLPAFSQGAFKEAKAFAQKNLLLIKDINFDVLLTPCASCASMIKKWHLLFKGDQEFFNLSKELSKKTFELSSFLIEEKNNLMGRIADIQGKIFFQLPCHHRYDHDNKDGILDFLDAFGFGLKKEDFLDCCGFGGIFSFSNPSLSEKIFKKNILKRIEKEKGQKTLITTCSGCLYWLKKKLSNFPNVKIIHLMELFENERD